MAQVFLSYSRSDGPFAEHLIDQLWQKGYETWKDDGYLEGGQQWMVEISRAIENAHAFLVIPSEESVASKEVRKELFLAYESEIEIIPVELEPVSIPHEMPIGNSNARIARGHRYGVPGLCHRDVW